MSQPDTNASPHDRVIVVEAPSVTKALDDVRTRTGVEPQVVDVDRVTRGGVGGFFARELVQVKLRIPATSTPGASPKKKRPAAQSDALAPAPLPESADVENVRVLDPKEVAREMLEMHAAGKAARTGKPQKVISLDEDQPARIAEPSGAITGAGQSPRLTSEPLNSAPLPAHLLRNDAPPEPDVQSRPAASPDVQVRGVDGVLQAMLAEQDKHDSTPADQNRGEAPARTPQRPRRPLGPTINPDNPDVIGALASPASSKPWHDNDVRRPASGAVDDTVANTSTTGSLRARIGGDRFAMVRDTSTPMPPRDEPSAAAKAGLTPAPAREALTKMARKNLGSDEVAEVLRGRPVTPPEEGTGAAATEPTGTTTDEEALDDIRAQLGVHHGDAGRRTAHDQAALASAALENLQQGRRRRAPLDATGTGNARSAEDESSDVSASEPTAQTLTEAVTEQVAQAPLPAPTDFASRLRRGTSRRASATSSTALSAMSLMALGLPVDLVRRLGDARPASDGAWLGTLEEALAPMVGELPSGSAVVVGPHAGYLAHELDIEFVELGGFPPYAGSVALGTDDSTEGRAWVREVAGERWVHLVAGGPGWSGHAASEVKAISIVGNADLPQALTLALRHDIPLGWVVPDGGTPRRASGLDLAIMIRELALSAQHRD